VIKTDTKQRYLDAIKDIRDMLLGPCPVDTVALLACEGVPTYLRRWTLSGSFLADICLDFQRILQGLDKVIEVCPSNPWLRLMRGRALIALKWHMAAIQDLEACLEIDSAERRLFLAEAHFGQAKETLNDEKLTYYTVAAIHATKSIQFHTPEHNSPRPYLLRAQADAHIAKLCDYQPGSAPFARKYREIEEDLRIARQLCNEEGRAIVDVVKANIDALLKS
jgi:hypothetical protein